MRRPGEYVEAIERGISYEERPTDPDPFATLAAMAAAEIARLDDALCEWRRVMRLRLGYTIKAKTYLFHEAVCSTPISSHA